MKRTLLLLLATLAVAGCTTTVNGELEIEHEGRKTNARTVKMNELIVHDETYEYRGKAYDLEKLEPILMEDKATLQRHPCMIKVAPTVPVVKFTKLLDVVAKLGVTNLNVMTLNE